MANNPSCREADLTVQTGIGDIFLTKAPGQSCPTAKEKGEKNPEKKSEKRLLYCISGNRLVSKSSWRWGERRHKIKNPTVKNLSKGSKKYIWVIFLQISSKAPSLQGLSATYTILHQMVFLRMQSACSYGGKQHLIKALPCPWQLRNSLTVTFPIKFQGILYQALTVSFDSTGCRLVWKK